MPSQTVGIQIAYNGRQPAPLPEPMKRARDKDLRGFAGEGNGVERSERHASAAKPEEHRALGYQEYTTKAGWLLGDVLIGASPISVLFA